LPPITLNHTNSESQLKERETHQTKKHKKRVAQKKYQKKNLCTNLQKKRMAQTRMPQGSGKRPPQMDERALLKGN
jgi:hypothetical protein